MSKSTFNKVKKIRKYPSVTIILPTSRTSPDNKQDIIRLKNLVTEAQNRLADEFSKRDLTGLKENLNRIDEIDMNHNKEGLVVFINEDLFEYVSLLFQPKERVVIDETFATRDLLRATHKAENYYVLALGRDKVRLFEGYLEEMNEIIDTNFPIENTTLFHTTSAERAVGSKEDQLLEEFFNRVDKIFLDYYKENPGDLILAGVDRNATHYRNIADQKDIIVGAINMDGETQKPHEFAADAWPLMRSVLQQRQQDAIEQLEAAVGANKFESDLQMIWTAINEGRGQTLYIEQGYFQPAKLDNGKITPVVDATETDVIDDIVDEMAEKTLEYGGKVVFLTDESLDKFQRIALITRY